ncbi:SRPBCC family protein [Streptomyces indicus]|uniref:Ligand-binding SRPBCC domain-containing protein n=1 Tax=Streptomyces indicus TaxID=417292 RepID=A0A1G9AUY8_9ACTN|nr:SRPBCC family protein [Streptomyces indicus]SDK31126.1 Ligand-binding SRPBCC domain-containing protein [Streptomyces indicus]
MIRFETTTRIAAPPERVFDLSLDVGLHTASMARSGERIVGGVTEGRMALGDTVTWRARHFGVPWRMTSRISAWERPSHFVDEQVAGPFARWVHTHDFAADGTGRGGTVMRDTVVFAAPFGPLGRLAEAAFLGRYMRRLIRQRNAHLRTAAETGGGDRAA